MTMIEVAFSERMNDSLKFANLTGRVLIFTVIHLNFPTFIFPLNAVNIALLEQWNVFHYNSKFNSLIFILLKPGLRR